MLVITLSRLIVIAENANLIDNENKTVLEVVLGTWNRDGNAPDDELDEPIIRKLGSLPQDKACRHVGVYTNAFLWRSTLTPVRCLSWKASRDEGAPRRAYGVHR